MDVSQELPSALQQARWPDTVEGRNRQPQQRCYQTSEGYGNGYNNAGQRRATGYTVTYEYAGRTFTEYRNRPPTGDTIKVRVNVVPN